MKATIVPAQITTVEDKVAGNLSLTQMLLLSVPVFGGSAIYIIFPPALSAAPYKIVLMTIVAVLFGLCAIRIKGKILILWMVIIARYKLRPRYYVFNKNDLYLRGKEVVTEPEPEPIEVVVKKPLGALAASLSTLEAVKLQAIINNPQAKLHFKTNKKGGLNVHVTEVKQ
jgi:hypothetical protein